MSQFQTVTFKGFEALVTAYVKSGWSGLVYLEMAGAEAEVRAIWAKLVSADMRKSGYTSSVKVAGGSGMRMEKHTKYISLRAVLPNGQHVYGLLHPHATVTEPVGEFYILAPADHDGPPTAFFPRLAQRLAVPIKEEWAAWLWQRGLEYGQYEYQHLITKLDSVGHMVGYIVKAHDAAAWLEVIQQELGFKFKEEEQ